MPSKQIRILQVNLQEHLVFLTGKTVVIISSQSVQHTGTVVSATPAELIIKNSRNLKIRFQTKDIAELFTDIHIEA